MHTTRGWAACLILPVCHLSGGLIPLTSAGSGPSLHRRSSPLGPLPFLRSASHTPGCLDVSLCSRKCPLYPRKRTWAVQLEMSAKGQKRTFSFLDQSGRSQRLVDHRFDLGDVRHRLVFAEYIVVLVEDLAVQHWLRLLITPR